MKLVIDIPDNYVGVVMANQKTVGTAMDKLLRQAVIDGTPLPKGHGDLKDAGALINNCAYDLDNNFVIDLIDVIMAPTIIEADKGGME